jgi:hypothetical protein
MTARRLLCAAALWLGLFAFAPAARAGVVAGKLELPTELGPAPLLGRAFVPRLANPLAPTPGLDPVPHLVVVLVPADGAVAPKPTTITWELRGESFARPLVAARLGDTLEIRNGGRGAPRFVAHGQPQLLPKKPLNPSDRLAVTPTQAGAPRSDRSSDAPPARPGADPAGRLLRLSRRQPPVRVPRRAGG